MGKNGYETSQVSPSPSIKNKNSKNQNLHFKDYNLNQNNIFTKTILKKEIKKTYIIAN